MPPVVRWSFLMVMKSCVSVNVASIAGLPAGIMGVYISVNTLCDMGATCENVLGDLACSVAMKNTAKLR